MLLLNVVIAGGALYTGVKVIQPVKKKNTLAELLSGKVHIQEVYGGHLPTTTCLV